ncbi:hypothetical protein BJ742DRAFT_121496 [Cladochytrium replicatum]|nr:hypothetical protein BJ742DRAFT_121496 [Cladochytrium replicatum]
MPRGDVSKKSHRKAQHGHPLRRAMCMRNLNLTFITDTNPKIDACRFRQKMIENTQQSATISHFKTSIPPTSRSSPPFLLSLVMALFLVGSALAMVSAQGVEDARTSTTTVYIHGDVTGAADNADMTDPEIAKRNSTVAAITLMALAGFMLVTGSVACACLRKRSKNKTRLRHRNPGWISSAESGRDTPIAFTPPPLPTTSTTPSPFQNDSLGRKGSLGPFRSAGHIVGTESWKSATTATSSPTLVQVQQEWENNAQAGKSQGLLPLPRHSPGRFPRPPVITVNRKDSSPSRYPIQPSTWPREGAKRPPPQRGMSEPAPPSSLSHPNKDAEVEDSGDDYDTDEGSGSDARNGSGTDGSELDDRRAARYLRVEHGAVPGPNVLVVQDWRVVQAQERRSSLQHYHSQRVAVLSQKNSGDALARTGPGHEGEAAAARAELAAVGGAGSPDPGSPLRRHRSIPHTMGLPVVPITEGETAESGHLLVDVSKLPNHTTRRASRQSQGTFEAQDELSKSPDASENKDAVVPGRVVSGIVYSYRAINAHVPHYPDELTLEKGDRVIVSAVYEDGWCFGVKIRELASSEEETEGGALPKISPDGFPGERGRRGSGVDTARDQHKMAHNQYIELAEGFFPVWCVRGESSERRRRSRRSLQPPGDASAAGKNRESMISTITSSVLSFFSGLKDGADAEKGAGEERPVSWSGTTTPVVRKKRVTSAYYEKGDLNRSATMNQGTQVRTQSRTLSLVPDSDPARTRRRVTEKAQGAHGVPKARRGSEGNASVGSVRTSGGSSISADGGNKMNRRWTVHGDTEFEIEILAELEKVARRYQRKNRGMTKSQQRLAKYSSRGIGNSSGGEPTGKEKEKGGTPNSPAQVAGSSGLIWSPVRQRVAGSIVSDNDKSSCASPPPSSVVSLGSDLTVVRTVLVDASVLASDVSSDADAHVVWRRAR